MDNHGLDFVIWIFCPPLLKVEKILTPLRTRTQLYLIKCQKQM